MVCELFFSEVVVLEKVLCWVVLLFVKELKLDRRDVYFSVNMFVEC